MKLRYLALAGVVAGGALLVPTVAPAQENAYSALAAGDGMRINFRMPDFLVVEDFIDAGAPTAQARIDSVGGSNGFASAPYPGQTVITGPGTFAIATGIQIPGNYPWYTASAYPAKPTNNVDQGLVVLDTKSDPQASHSNARLGAPEGSGRTVADAAVSRADDGTVTAAATTYADLVKVGPVTISGLTSKATVVRKPGGGPQRSSSLAVGSFTIGDTAVTAGPDGLVIAGTKIPAQSVPGVADALAKANVHIDTVKAADTDDGVVAPGLRITTTQPVPGAGVPGTVTYTLGQAVALATAGSVPPIGFDDSLPPLPGSTEATPPAAGPGGTPAGSDGGEPYPPPPRHTPATGASLTGGLRGGSGDSGGYGASLPVAPSSPLAPETAAPAGGGGSAVAGAAGGGAASPGELAALATTKPPSSISTWTLFPILAIAGGLVALAAYGSRLMRVRKSWSS